MDSTGEDLHPNWRALSTIHIPLKRFVREGFQGSTKEKTNEKFSVLGVSGTEAARFYTEILDTPPAKITKFARSHKVRRPTFSKKCLQQPFDKKKFFRFAMSNDVNALQNMLIKDNEINICDEFGWTALMMAACEGAEATVKWLCEFGADRYVRDKAGNTAITLAGKNSFHNIVDLLEMTTTTTATQHNDGAGSTSTVTIVEPFYCEICQRTYNETSMRSHQTSTVHQFSEKSKVSLNKLNKFNISVKNRGLQLMVKQGWDREHGLGPKQSGRLYPVKTTLRKARTGIGIEQPAARVTHFAAFDIRATQLRDAPLVRTQTRDDMKREKLRNWKRERRLRRELS